MTLTETLDTLIDRWCARRALKPLTYILKAYPQPLVHTDQVCDLLDALKSIKGLCRNEVTQEELQMLIEVHNQLEDSVNKYFSR